MPSDPADAPTRTGREQLHQRIEQAAIDYHKRTDGTGEGEYGCNGATCPGVQRLLAFWLTVVERELGEQSRRVDELRDWSQRMFEFTPLEQSTKRNLHHAYSIRLAELVQSLAPVEQAASPSSAEGQQETRMFPVMSDILPLSCAERERLQQLAEKATEGPWTNGMHGNNDAHMCLIVTRAKLSDATVDCGYGIGRTWHPEKLMAYVGISRQQCIDNAEFIAAAREALPRYEQTVRALEVIAKNVLHCDNCGGSYWSGGTGTVSCPLCRVRALEAERDALRDCISDLRDGKDR